MIWQGSRTNFSIICPVEDQEGPQTLPFLKFYPLFFVFLSAWTLQLHQVLHILALFLPLLYAYRSFRHPLLARLALHGKPFHCWCMYCPKNVKYWKVTCWISVHLRKKYILYKKLYRNNRIRINITFLSGRDNVKRALAADAGNAHITFAEFLSTHSNDTGENSGKYSWMSSDRTMLPSNPLIWIASKRNWRSDLGMFPSISSSDMPKLNQNKKT